jgi:hypothetical protein
MLNISAVQPWRHLRSGTKSLHWQPCYLNKLRFSDWQEILNETFDSAYFVKLKSEADSHRMYLTDEIRQELADYSEEELLTTTFIAIARKGET